MKHGLWIFSGVVIAIAGVTWLFASKTVEVEVTLPAPASSASASSVSKMKSFPPAKPQPPEPAPVLPPPNLYTSKDGMLVRDRVIELSGYYFPRTEVRVGKFQLKMLAFGSAEHLTEFEQKGQTIPTWTPVMFEFADMTSQEILGDYGPYRKNTLRVFCKTYRITREALDFECHDPQVGKVTFSGKVDPAFAAAQSDENSGVGSTDYAVITGDLTVGGQVFRKIGFDYWMGD